MGRRVPYKSQLLDHSGMWWGSEVEVPTLNQSVQSSAVCVFRFHYALRKKTTTKKPPKQQNQPHKFLGDPRSVTQLLLYLKVSDQESILYEFFF